jgi:hypothetical protein
MLRIAEVVSDANASLTAPTPHSRLFGTGHRGSGWTSAVRLLRAAINVALQHSNWHRPSITTDTVGVVVIDRIAELNTAGLNVLAMVFAILLKASHGSCSNIMEEEKDHGSS